MAFFIPIGVVIVAAKVASAVINGVIASSGWVASAAGAVAKTKAGAPIANFVSNTATTIVQATPPGVKDFISNTGNIIIETHKKLDDFVTSHTPNEGSSAKTAMDTLKKADDVKGYGDKLDKVTKKFETSHEAGESTKPNPKQLKEDEKPSSTTIQLDTRVSQNSTLLETAKSPSPAPGSPDAAEAKQRQSIEGKQDESPSSRKHTLK